MKNQKSKNSKAKSRSKKQQNNSRKGYLALLLLLGISVGFAALSTTLNVIGTTTVNRQNWSIVFADQVSNEQKVGTAEGSATVTAATNEASAKVEFTATLKEPGDSYSFEIPINNEGSIDAVLESFSNTELTTEQAKYLDYTVEYKSVATGTKTVTSRDAIHANKGVTLVVTVTYKNDITANDLPSGTSDPVFSSTFTVNYKQYKSTTDTDPVRFVTTSE